MVERLRLALITERFGRRFGGAESYAVHLFERLSQQHDVTVIAREFDHTLDIKQITVGRMTGWPGWMRALHFAWHAKRLTRDGYDVVHTHAMGPAGDVHVVHVVPVKYRRFFMQSRLRAMLSCLQPRNLAYLWLEAASVRSLPHRHVVAVSPSVKEQLSLAYPAGQSVELIPPGVDVVSVNTQVRHALRTQFDWHEADIGCVLVARNPLLKGFAAVLEALAKLPEHYKLAVVGADAQAEGYLRDRYPDLIARVTLRGPVSDVSPFYQAADLCVHPTLQDSFGMAPLEAMAHSLPVVLSGLPYCGFAKFVKHQHDAWVLENPKDANAIAAALLALGQDPLLRERLVKNSMTVVQAFPWDTVAQRYLAIYLDVVRQRRQV